MHFTIPEFDHLYVISDLHMGGERDVHLGGHTNSQIFDAGELLADTIDVLTEKAPEKRVALVINGDSVDFIAEKNAVYFDANGAIVKLQRIVDDEAFRPVWQALHRFVKAKHRTLLINLGNHDLELALPQVRERLLDILTAGDAELRGSIQLVFDGTGVRCRVGSADVLCLHGNEVDTWNICDYEELRQQGRDGNCGLARAMWTPNAGTKLVVDVMNDIKRCFPFVDLLKPETQAVLPTLYALDPSVKWKLPSVLKVAGRLAVDKVKRKFGFLEGDDESTTSAANAVASGVTADQLLRNAFSSMAQSPDDTQALLLETEQHFRDGVSPTALLSEVGEEQLGIRRAIGGFFTGKPTHELLREALEGLCADDTFEPSKRDSTFIDTDEIVGSEIDFLITGHTHLYRALRRQRGGFYFNSGTWVRLIQLRPDVLQDEVTFKRFYRAIEKGTMAALDDERDMVMRRPTVVAIRQRDGQVTGVLLEAKKTADSVSLDEISGTRFVKGYQ